MSSESDLSPHAHALAPGTQIRDYTIVSVIGTGGFSIVYKATDNSLDRAVAIKEYFPGSFALRDHEGSVYPHSRDTAMFAKGIESFLNEGKLLAAFDHPALVRVYRCWEERGTAYLAMRLYEGTTLRDAVNAGDWRTDVATLRALLLPMCNALDVLHAAKCYHRDVAPDNIMLVAGSHEGSRLAPVLLDFGAARKAIESTQVFTAILKPGYAPIEQYGDGELKQGPWTDIYALAGVVHFMLAGNAPPTAISRMIRDAMPRPRDAFVGRLPEQWLDAIEAALAVKPEARPQSISEFVALFGWDATAESMTTVVSPPLPVALPEVALDAAVTTLVDERTVVVPLPQKRAPAVPAVASPEPATLTDDDRTVVMPHRELDAQISAKKKAETARTADAGATPKGAPKIIWIAAAAGLIAVAALTWKLTSTPAVAPVTTSTTDSKGIAPVDAKATAKTKAGNDTSSDKKTSLPIEAPPKPVINVPDTITIIPAPVTAPPANVIIEPPKAAVTESPTASASAAKAKAAANAKEKARASRASAVNADGREDAPPARAGKRPARCEVLIERFGLGETVSAADQRFFQESCK